MYSHAPPAPPPKPPGSHDVSRMSTPAGGPTPRPPPLPQEISIRQGGIENFEGSGGADYRDSQPQGIPDPGDQWLPKYLEDKSKQDLATILSDPTLLSALTHAPQTAHPSLQLSHDTLQAALAENTERATQLLDLESRLGHQRSAAQAQLLATHALERQWRAKQGDMDHALAPFAPASLYQRLAQGVVEQEGVCYALEESFLEGGNGGGGRSGERESSVGGGADDGVLATERELGDWLRRYREAKKLYYLRQERKERWDEGRVGGWR